MSEKMAGDSFDLMYISWEKNLSLITKNTVMAKLQKFPIVFLTGSKSYLPVVFDSSV